MMALRRAGVGLRFTLLLIFTFLVVTSTASNASLMTTEELTQKSELIVTGKVVSVESRWTDQHDDIFTFVRIQVDSVIKGELDEATIVLKTYGGVVGSTTVAVTGSPRFAIEERVLLFLEAFDRDKATGAPLNYVPYNMDQGKLSILVNKQGDEVLFGRSARADRLKPRANVAKAYLGAPQLLNDMIQDVNSHLDGESN